MKLIIFLIFISMFSSYGMNAYSQATKLNLEMKNSTVKEILNKIEKVSDYRFFYSSNVDLNMKADVSVKDKKISDILDDIFKGSSVKHQVIGHQIALFENNENSLFSDQQPMSVNGTVTDDKGNTLPGVTISVKGSNRNTSTTVTGSFSINLPSQPATLVFSMIGFVNKEIQVKAGDVLNVELVPSVKNLDEVVVLGFAKQKKINVTGAVSVVKGGELVNRPDQTLTMAMEGKVPGVTFTAGTYGFEPGAMMSLQIRGQGAPLYLIDGVSGSPNGLNPNDIETISVLKDAAASAIYGAQAPYGVVLITTKSGKRDGQLSIEYNQTFTKTKPIRLPHLADSYTTAKAYNEAAVNSGITPVYTNLVIDRILQYQADPKHTPETYPSSANPAIWGNTAESNANYDWFNVFYGDGVKNQQNIAVSGGSKTVGYYLSAGHVYDNGMLKVAKDDFHRYNTTMKFDASLGNFLKLDVNSRYFNTIRTRPAFDNQGDYDLLFHQVARTVPSQYLTSPNGVISIQSKIPWTKDAGSEVTDGKEFANRFSFELTPLKGWTINGDYSFRLVSTEFISNNYTVYEDKVDGSPVVSGSTSPSLVKKSQQIFLANSYNIYSTYKFDVKQNHHFSILGGYQLEQTHTSYLYATRNDMISQDVPSISTTTGTINATDNLDQTGTMGYFSRFNYNYKEKYLLELNGRYDGTYKFADGKKWGFFPSVSGGWNISNEKFWSKFRSAVNIFKIRASYGDLGNMSTAAAYADLPLLGIGSNLGWLLNGTRPSYTTAPGLVNTGLTWESSRTKNLGADLSFLNNRLSFTGDIYQRQTYNQLGPSNAVPAVIGAAVPQSNNMERRTNGWEASVTWQDHINDFHYSVTAMMYDNLTKVTKYNNPTGILSTSYAGQTVGEIWGWVSNGLIQTQAEADLINGKGIQKAISGQIWKTGDVKYVDLDGDSVITAGANTIANHGDKRVIGNNTPRYQFGLTTTAEWKGFDFTMFWQGTGKRDLMLTDNMFYGFTWWFQSSIFTDHLNYYRDAPGDKYTGLGLNTNAYFPRPYTDANMSAKNQTANTRYIQNGAYARLKTLQFGYHFPSSLLKKIKMNNLYLYVTGENLITLTSLLPSFDPEVANIGARGNGKSMTAQASYMVGINVKF